MKNQSPFLDFVENINNTGSMPGIMGILISDERMIELEQYLLDKYGEPDNSEEQQIHKSIIFGGLTFLPYQHKDTLLKIVYGT